MKLNPHARQFYKVEVVTDPPVAGWEASFDGGTTWDTGEDDPLLADTWRWLVAGSLADPGTSVAVVAQTTWPLVRATDNPEILVEDAPPIFVY